MPLEEQIKIDEPTGEGYTPVPDGLYQVIVTDVRIHKGKKYQSNEEENQLLFSTEVVEGEHKGHGIGVFARMSWFNGVTKKGTSVDPSKLYSFVKAIYGFYNPKVDVDTLNIKDINMDFVNDLIGKQLQLSVKLVNDKNRITDFIKIGKEVKIETTEGDTKQDVDPDDIPF